MMNTYKSLLWKPEGRDHLGDLDVDGRIILKCLGCEDRGWFKT
jgi:hypothetical protein